MYQELTATQNACLDRAKQCGYLVCTGAGNDMLLHVWIEWCKEQNQVCLHALLYGEQCEVVLNTTTTTNQRVKGNASALQNACNKYVRKVDQAYVHDTDGCRVSGVRIDHVSEACEDVLSVARFHWPQAS
jgi:hypothetical protein